MYMFQIYLTKVFFTHRLIGRDVSLPSIINTKKGNKRDGNKGFLNMVQGNHSIKIKIKTFILWLVHSFFFANEKDT